MTTLHDFGVCWDGLWTLSFELSQLHGHGSWLVCEVALSFGLMLAFSRQRQKIGNNFQNARRFKNEN
jgi:hypothetical protein